MHQEFHKDILDFKNQVKYMHAQLMQLDV